MLFSHFFMVVVHRVMICLFFKFPDVYGNNKTSLENKKGEEREASHSE
jgi:hypothetical protein